MTIVIRRNASDRVIELGGGDQPKVHPRCMGGNDLNVDMRLCQNAQGQQTVDFTADFNEPLPIQDAEWDALFCMYSAEHVSWRKLPQFLSECARIIKPNALATFIVPNTEAQMRHLLDTQDWDDAGSMLFGGQDHEGNHHMAFLNPTLFSRYLTDAGFSKIRTLPHGAKGTDMIVTCEKNGIHNIPPAVSPVLVQPPPPPTQAFQPSEPPKPILPPAEVIFDRRYFNAGPNGMNSPYKGYQPFLIDRPQNEIIARNVLTRKPASILELGCGRGYVLKRLQDHGIPSAGVDVSKHAYLTRVCEYIERYDLTESSWSISNKADLCFSFAFLEHIPEDKLPALVAEMERTCQRGLHGVTTHDDGQDLTRVTIRPIEWWRERLPRGHEVLPKEQLEQGGFPEAVFKGDGQKRLNIGSCYTMYHGWINCDILELGQYATGQGYHFQKFDARQGIPYNGGEIQAIMIVHMLEHLTYAEGQTLLRECRRVMKNDGVVRIMVPDANLLTKRYQEGTLGEFDEVNEGCANAPTQAGKLYSLLNENHLAVYDQETLSQMLENAGFEALPGEFRKTRAGAQGEYVLKTTYDHHYSLSAVIEGVPRR